MSQEPVEWCVVFSERRPDTPWWLRWMRPGFQHVFAYRQLDPERVLVVNQVGTALQCNVAPQAVVDFTRNLMHPPDGAWQPSRFILIDRRVPAPLRPFPRGPMTCVETIKALLGIRALWIITPRQLWRRLRADGAMVLYPIPKQGG